MLDFNPYGGKMSDYQKQLEEKIRKLEKRVRELEQTEKAVRASEAKYRSILDNSPAVIFIKDPAGKYQYINRTYEKLHGVTNEQVRGLTDFDIFPAELARQFRENDRTVLKSDGPLKIEEKVPQKDGMHTVLSIKFPLLDPRKKTHAICGIATDITDRKKAQTALQGNEMRFRSLFENMYDGVAIYRPENDGDDFLIVDLNKSGQTLSKVQRERIVGRRVTEIFPGVKEMGLFNVLQNVYRTGNPEQLPVTQYKDDRLTEWVDNTVFKLPTNEIVAVYRDETKRHMAEEEIKRLNKKLEDRVFQRTRQLEEAHEELEDFVYSVSHDLRAPLRSISGFAEIIHRRHKKALNEEGRHYFENIIEASKQMGNLIDDLLEFSRLGKKSKKSGKVLLDQVFKAAVDTLSGRIEQTGARITLPGHLPVIVGDATLLTHIFINLLENAVKYHKPGYAAPD